MTTTGIPNKCLVCGLVSYQDKHGCVQALLDYVRELEEKIERLKAKRK